MPRAVRITSLVICLSVGATLLVSEELCARVPDSLVIALLEQIQVKLANHEFDRADSLCGVLIRERADDPSGHLFRAAGLLNRMFDREEPTDTERFFALLDSVTDLTSADRSAGSLSDRSWLSLWEGHAHVHRSLWEAHFGSITSALSHALKARSAYEQGLAFDSTNADLYFGLGNFHYWKTAKAGLLASVGIIRNDLERGIAELAIARERSLVSRMAARDAMIWIWLDMGMYDSTIALCNERLAHFPEGRQYRWPLAEALAKSGATHAAYTGYESLRRGFADAPGNYVNLLTIDYHLYLIGESDDKVEKCREIVTQFKRYRREIPRETRQKRRDEYAYLVRAARL